MQLVRPLLALILMAIATEIAHAQIVLPSDLGVAMIASPTTNLQPASRST